MTIYNKEQIENGTLSAKELLDSWTSGQGATGKNAQSFIHVKNGAINNIPVSIALLTALAEKELARTKPNQSFYDALSKGYLSVNHFDEYKEVKPAAKPLVGHYLTAAEYLQVQYDKLPALPVPTIEDIVKLLDYKPSMNKTELLAVLDAIKAICTPKAYTTADLTIEQWNKYQDLINKETALASASSALGVYLEDIKPVSDTTLQGKFRPELGTGGLLNQLITEEKYKILVTTPVPAKLDASFAIVEAGYILFSIQVITV